MHSKLWLSYSVVQYLCTQYVCVQYTHIYSCYSLHTTDPDREGVDTFLECKPPKFTNMPPCLAQTLACTDATVNVPSLTRNILVDFKTFANRD